MRTGRYSIGELFASRHLEQFVIPEIQRDYVWKSKPVDGLLASILGNFAKWKKETADPRVTVEANGSPNSVIPAHELDALKKSFVSFYAQRVWATNIGFIYAYCDADLPGQYALIDGQQRLTTIYLLLLALASMDENGRLKDRFRARYCLMDREDSPKQAASTRLDYRLREETARFLRQFAAFSLETSPQPKEVSKQVRNQGWCLTRDLEDPTAMNLIQSFDIIVRRLTSEASVSLHDLYDYVENLVECWYFDTNESAQGEELYLYLNARGESIADNENQKAYLLKEIGDGEKKADWGRKWEEWQDFFWQNRLIGLTDNNENPNADRGLNSFLGCIQYLEKLKHASETPKQPSLETIEKYVQVLLWLKEQKHHFASLFMHHDWVDEWFSELWGILNRKTAAKWCADPADDNESTARKQMVLVWGSLLCGAKAQTFETPDVERLDCERIFRIIRLLYLRYHNSRRAVIGLPQLVDELFEGNPGQLTGEEQLKWDFLATKTRDWERREYESLIWQIEDHTLNLDGSDVEALNLSHLMELDSQSTTLEHLRHVRDKFNELFPLEGGRFRPGSKQFDLTATLLYYGPFWKQTSPWYYQNYDLGDWKLTIRGKGNREAPAHQHVFKQFFQDFVKSGQTLEVFLSGKRGTVDVNPGTTTDLRLALIWYSEKLGPKLFDKGQYIAGSPSPGQERDFHFPNFPPLWNTGGSFRGYGNQQLSSIVPSDSST